MLLAHELLFDSIYSKENEAMSKIEMRNVAEHNVSERESDRKNFLFLRRLHVG